MHTLQVNCEDGQYVVFHNGDFSGEIIVQRRASLKPGARDSSEVTVPYAVMEAVVAANLQSELIGALEQMAPAEFLNFLAGLKQ